MAIKTEGIELTVDFWEGQWDKIEVASEGDAETEDKIPVVENLSDRTRCTAFFDDTEANFQIVNVRMYVGAVLVAETAVNILKTNRQSLTVVRTDILEAT